MGGGVAICVKRKDASATLKESEGNKTEMIVTRHSQFIRPINIITVYGEQECRSKREYIEESLNEVLEVLSSIEANDEEALLIGDLNRPHIGGLVDKNDDKLSYGGSLIVDLLSSNQYDLVNLSNKTTGGPHTRYSPEDYSDVSKRSCLDLCIVSSGLSPYVKSLEIDNALRFTPGYSTGSIFKYSDHFSLLTLDKIPMRDKKRPTEKKEPIPYGTQINLEVGKNIFQ